MKKNRELAACKTLANSRLDDCLLLIQPTKPDIHNPLHARSCADTCSHLLDKRRQRMRQIAALCSPCNRQSLCAPCQCTAHDELYKPTC